MVQEGRKHGEDLIKLAGATDRKAGSDLGSTGPTYYDGQRVYFQIADYTKDASWNRYAEAAGVVYRDQNVSPLGGKVFGFWIFTRGLAMDWQRNKREASRDAVLLLARNGAYAADDTPLAYTRPESHSREVAYVIQSYLDAEQLGAPRRERLASLVDQALGHIDQWFVKKSSKEWAPFMFALTAESLIRYHNEVKKDPRILPAIKLGADTLWKEAWIQQKNGFFLHADKPGEAAPDLNLLIVPVFGWLYLQTGDTTYLERGDTIFAAGVQNAHQGTQKHFNQNYRWSFDYIRWRKEADAAKSSQ